MRRSGAFRPEIPIGRLPPRLGGEAPGKRQNRHARTCWRRRTGVETVIVLIGISAFAVVAFLAGVGAFIVDEVREEPWPIGAMALGAYALLLCLVAAVLFTP